MPSLSRSQRIKEQHAELRRLTDRLLDLLASEVDWEEVRLFLLDIERVLLAHFATEENGGFMAELRVRWPALGPELDALGGAHEDLTAALQRLRKLAEERRDLQALKEGFLEFTEHLKEHEAAEGSLLGAREAWGSS